MGNSAVPQTGPKFEEPKVDYLSELPSELVLKILHFLDVPDAVHCRIVSRRWHSIISSFSGYWKEACRRSGLSPLAVEKLAPVSGELPSLVVAALRHRQRLSSLSLSSRVGHLVSQPHKAVCNVRIRGLVTRSTNLGIQGNISQRCCFIGQTYILTSDNWPPDIYSVNTSDFIRGSSDKSVTKLFCNPNTCGSIKTYSASLSTSPGQVLWAKASADYILLLRHLTGEWIGYCPLKNEIVLHWKSHFRKSYSPVPMGRSSATHITCCENCFLVCVAQAVSSSSTFWELQILKIGKGSIIEPEVASKRTMLVQLQPGGEIVDWALTQNRSQASAGTDEQGFCKRHRLVCQSNTFVCAYTVDLSMPEAKMVIKCDSALVPSCKCHVLDSTTGLRTVTSINLSQDCQLLGCVINPFHLYIWEVESLQLVTSVELKWAREYHAQELGIIALGHVYSVVHTNDGKPGSFIHIISTQTGELVCERKSRVQWYVGANRFNCVQLLHQEWLSDVYSHDAPVFVYVNQSVSSATAAGVTVHPLSFVEFMSYKQRSHFLQ